MTWKPHATVAAVIEQDGRYLLVEEMDAGHRVLNQPAGHLEEGESLVEAVKRETLEETGRTFEPSKLIGIYRWRSPANGITYLRFAFAGSCSQPLPGCKLDPDILANHWFEWEQMVQRQEELRSPLVLRCVADLREGRGFSLEALVELG